MHAPTFILFSQPVINALDNGNIAQLISEGQCLQHELLDSICLTNTQFVVFDGDVLKYWSFIQTLDNVIVTKKLDDKV